jgi:hypothetical protein
MRTAGLFVANGVDATTGGYLLEPMAVDAVGDAARSAEIEATLLAALRSRHLRATESVLAPRHGMDPGELAETGWGVVFAYDARPAIRQALKPLLDRRHDQAAAIVEHRYREFTGGGGYRRGESKIEFLGRHGSGPGPVDPDVMPYYLLLVGGPGEIPFELQYQLGVQHAVGRVHFDDVDGYARYADNVVAAETMSSRTGPAQLTFFAARNADDVATALAAEHLVQPLASSLGAEDDRWRVRSRVGPDATRDSLEDLLETSRPGVLFTATHGLGLPPGHPEQYVAQGGLVCQDWPGPAHGRITKAHWFDARDVPGGDLTGMIAFLFACFGAGTPDQDEFSRLTDRRILAPAPFVAALPKALLGRDGGALAVVGHVDRALGYSFVWPGAGRQIEVYRSTLAALGSGQPIGSALEYVSDRHAELATELRQALDDIRLGKRADNTLLAGLWSASTDARGFILLGDPAARVSAVVGDAATRAIHLTTGIGPQPPSEQRPATTVGGTPARSDPIEVATYTTDDPDGVAYDPATGRIGGARLCLLSRVDIDGTATHVTTTHGPGVQSDPTVAQLHARMVELSIAARLGCDDRGGSP